MLGITKQIGQIYIYPNGLSCKSSRYATERKESSTSITHVNAFVSEKLLVRIFNLRGSVSEACVGM